MGSGKRRTKKRTKRSATSSRSESRSRIVSITPDEIERTLREQGFTPRGDY